MADLIIKLSYFLSSSSKYREFKHYINTILNDESSLKKRIFDIFMIFLVLITIYILIDDKSQTNQLYNTIETIAVTIFIIEWLFRLWVTSDMHKSIINNYEKYQLLGRSYRVSKTLKEIVIDKLKFISTPMAIIDLLAILPSFRSFRILRIFLIFRLFKLFRYTTSAKEFMSVFIEKRFEFGTLAILFGFVIFFSTTAIYMFEKDLNKDINSFFDAIYWSMITISTVGYGDITPVTIEGKIVTFMLIFGGITTIVLATSIATTALTAKLEIIKEENIKNEATKLKNFTIICGFGEIGLVLAKELKETKENFIIIDEKEQEIIKAKEKHYLAIKGDASNIELLTNLNLKHNVKAVVIITENDATNLSILLSVKSIDSKIKTVVRANQKSTKAKFKIAGASSVIFPDELAALMGVEYIGQPMAFDVIDNIIVSKGGATIDEVDVVDGLDGKRLIETQYYKYKIKVIGIIRDNINNFIFHPSDEFILQRSDKLIVLGHSDLIASFHLWCMKK